MYNTLEWLQSTFFTITSKSGATKWRKTKLTFGVSELTCTNEEKITATKTSVLMLVPYQKKLDV